MKSDPELHFSLAAAYDERRFQELLNSETDDGKFAILAQLLSGEIERFKGRSS